MKQSSVINTITTLLSAIIGFVLFYITGDMVLALLIGLPCVIVVFIVGNLLIKKANAARKTD